MLKLLLGWNPDFDIQAGSLPRLNSEFTASTVEDAHGNVSGYQFHRGKEFMGVTLVDAQNLPACVTGPGQEDEAIVRQGNNRPLKVQVKKAEQQHRRLLGKGQHQQQRPRCQSLP